MVKFNDRRRQAAVEAKHAAAQAKRDTVPNGYEQIPESDWDAHDGQRVYHKGDTHRTLQVDKSAGFTRYFAGSQITKGYGHELYKKSTKPKKTKGGLGPNGEPGLTIL